MFKRFQVLDLFHSESERKEVKEWMDVKTHVPDIKTAIFKVKLSDGSIQDAYFCQDACTDLVNGYNAGYRTQIKPSEWWSQKDKQPLHNVTHWGKPS